ncbi:MAG TPA: glycoside hydrolase family 127 protein [Gemmataceae bacterium]|nr:glycoside hydrolase family 127 protein [Gemmataceae bacterium]
MRGLAVVSLVALVGPVLAQSPHAIVGPAEARWTTGFWADRFETCRTATVPAMGALMAGTDPTQFLHNFRIAAGLAAGKHRGPPWNDGDFYKWLEAAAAVHAARPDPALDKQMDEAIGIIARAQRADGYLHTPVLIANRNGGAAKPFQDRLNFEMYNFGHLFTAACVHYRATGKRTLLAVAEEAAGFLARAFENPTPELARNAVCPAHYMGTIDLYRVTKDPTHLRLAVKFLDLRDVPVADGTDDNQDRVPFRKQTEAAGHAVRANYLYAGAADVYAETGDATLLAPLTAIWMNMTGRKMYLTGACGALYDGASPDGSKDQKRIARVHQAYGRDYQLPHSTAHNETCAAIGNVLWTERMLRITGEAKYADVLEVALYNAVLAGISLDGKRCFYTNTLRQLDTMPAPLRWSRSREEWISCYCCPPNAARTVARVNELAYGRSARGVWVHLYGGSTLDTELPGGRRLKLTQETAYPWDGRVKLTLTAAPAGEMSLFLRIPGWADGATLSMNGEPVTATVGRYAEVRRTWAAGDVVELTLPMNPRLVEANPLVEEARNQVAVMRGPLVYCLESTDLPRDVRLQSVALPRAGKLTPRFDRGQLGGVTILESKAEAAAAAAWDGRLYREYKPATPRTVDVKLIPYFAWANRGKSEMTVWMPLGR